MMKHIKKTLFVNVACTVLYLFSSTETVRAAQVDVAVNTLSLSGTPGTLVFDFASGGGPANEVILSSFNPAAIISTSTDSGGASGTLQAGVTLSDSTFFFSEYTVRIAFQSSFTFVVNTTNNSPGTSFSPDEFSFFVFDSTGTNSLITTNDPSGVNSLFLIDLDGSSSGAVTTFETLGSPNLPISLTEESSGVPEPGTLELGLSSCVLYAAYLIRQKSVRSRID